MSFRIFIWMFIFFVVSGCTFFPKLERSDSGVAPKKNLIAHIVPAENIVGRFENNIERSAPLIVGDTLYQGSVHNRFFALHKKTGRVIWQKTISGGVESSATYFDQKVYFGGNDGVFYCVEASTGKTVWEYNVKVEILSTPLVVGGIVYFSTIQNNLYALKADSGEWVWYHSKGYEQKFSVRGSSSPVYQDGKIYIGFSDGTFSALNAFDGKLLWSKQLSQEGKFSDIDATPIVGAQDIISGSQDGELYSLDLNGNEKWKMRYLDMTDIVANHQFIFVTVMSRYVFCLKRENGHKVWQTRLKIGIPLGIILVEDQVIVNTDDRYVYSLSMDNGKEIWRYNVDTGITSKTAYDSEKVYIFSNHSVLHVVDPFYLLNDV